MEKAINALPKTSAIMPGAGVIDVIADAVMQILDPIWLDHDYIAIRSQDGPEKRTKEGTALRASSEWIDGRKTRRKMAGTAGFLLTDLSSLARVIESMVCNGYWRTGNRIVLIAGTGAWGDDMPERYATAIRDATLVAVVGDVA